MTTIDPVNFGIALLGAVLGLISTIYLVRQNRVRLRVELSHAFLGAPGGTPLHGVGTMR